MTSMNGLARGVQFDKATHSYTYRGRNLSGITHLISDRLNISYGGFMADERAVEGTHVHEAVDMWVKSGLKVSEHPAVDWIIRELKLRFEKMPPISVFSEVLVTDYDKYASAVDLMVQYEHGWELYDIKTGKFNPAYLSWQLGVYKYFVEKAGLKVIGTACICTRDRMFYRVLPEKKERVEELLYKNEKTPLTRKMKGFKIHNTGDKK